MILAKIRDAVTEANISWQKHSLQRMFERSITRAEVKTAILNGIWVRHGVCNLSYFQAKKL